MDEVHTMVVQAIQKGEIIMEYQYEVEQTKEEFMHEDQWADSLIKWLFIFLIIVGIPYTAYVVVQFILSV